MNRKEKKRNYEISYIFNEDGKSLKEILDSTFKEQMIDNILLIKKSPNDLQNKKINDTIKS